MFKARIFMKEFKETIDKISGAYDSKTAKLIPVCGDILIKPFDKKLTFSTTDSKSTLDLYCEAEILSEGTILVPYDNLKQIKDLKSDFIVLSEIENKLIVSAEKKTLIMALSKNPAEDFRQPEDKPETALLTTTAEDLKETMEKLSLYISSDKARPALNCFHIDVESCIMETSSMFRICRRNYTNGEINIENPYKSVLIPGNTYGKIKKCLKSGNITISTTDNSDFVSVSGVNFKFTTRICEGDFINTNKIFNKSKATQITFNSKELKEIISYAVKLQKTSDIREAVTIYSRNESVYLYAESKGIQSLDRINTEKNNAENGFNISIDSLFIKDLYNTVETENITFYMENKLTPVTVYGGKFDILICPIKPKDKITEYIEKCIEQSK